MASVSRQPFAPLDGTRLQNLTSLKNRQNSIQSSPAAAKRKAELIDTDDSENVDPLFFAKRSKASKSFHGSSKDGLCKPNHFVLKAVSTPKPFTSAVSAPVQTPSLSGSASSRRTLQPKSPAAKLNTSITKSSSLSVPAGRSPTRGKRSGILSNRKRTTGGFSRVDPPSFNLGSNAPFSLDAALKGTIRGYSARPSVSKASTTKSSATEPEMKASWFFDIHEDSAEQEMTNLLQHGTCVLDISSDEESAQRARQEGREDKENVPPVDDVSQTSGRAQNRLRDRNVDEMVIEKERIALGEMSASDFYPEGCDENSVIIIPGDDEAPQENTNAQEPQQIEPIVKDFEFAPELQPLPASPEPEHISEPEFVPEVDFDTLMSRNEETKSSKASVLQPIDGTGESFELWESGSSKDENETPATVSS